MEGSNCALIERASASEVSDRATTSTPLLVGQHHSPSPYPWPVQRSHCSGGEGGRAGVVVGSKRRWCCGRSVRGSEMWRKNMTSGSRGIFDISHCLSLLFNQKLIL
uniref:Uncharacterized protein n=1 Tax=Oryza sativa subsp. japonica TaxID=39947 RepID=Q6Z9U1_ORYSJ|nr:hypothetical protein [Oryza sativa Japonica Group]